MNSIATTVGYMVLIGGAIWLLSKFLESHEQERYTEHAVLGFERDLAYRAIYRSTSDPAVRQMVKDHCGSWSIMGLDLDDDAFYESRAEDPAFRKAWDTVRQEGPAWVLKDGRIVLRKELTAST